MMVVDGFSVLAQPKAKAKMNIRQIFIIFSCSPIKRDPTLKSKTTRICSDKLRRSEVVSARPAPEPKLHICIYAPLNSRGVPLGPGEEAVERWPCPYRDRIQIGL